MSHRRAAVLVRIVAVVVLAGGGFVVLQKPARHFEAQAASGLLRLAGANGVFVASRSTIQVVPARHAPFRAIVTPTCSSLASVLAVAGLASLTPKRGPRARLRRLSATAAAVGTVFTGNVLRIAASLAVGLVAGRTSLILFHDWVGSIFGFAYTLGGYVLLLYLLLARHPQPTKEQSPWHRSPSWPPPPPASSYS